MDEQKKKRYLEIEPIAGEDAVMIVEITMKDLDYYINLIDKAWAGLGRTDSNFERSPTLLLVML